MKTPSKNPILSLTIQGAIISLLPVIGGMFKLDFGDAKSFVEGAVAFVGLGMTIYGRIRAVKRIG